MRCVCLGGLAAALVLGLSAAARGEDAAAALLDKAIKAQGGEEALAKYKAHRIKVKGTFGEGVEFSQERSFMLPDKVKEVSEYTGGGRTTRSVSVFDGKKVTFEANGQEVATTETTVTQYKEACYRLRVMDLVALKGKEFELSPVGEVKVEGKPALGLLVKSKGQKDISLFFDKETGLMVKVVYQATDASGEEVATERVITEHQKAGGLQVAKKVAIYREGKKQMEFEVTGYEPLEKLGDDEFKK